MKFLLLPLIAFFISAPTVANSDDQNCSKEVYGAVGRYLRIEKFLPTRQGGTIVTEACKVWPYDKTRLLAVLAYDSGVEYEKSLVVAILDRKTFRVVASYRGVIGEDAVTEVGNGSLSIDTANYQLSQDISAFGVRFTSSVGDPSCADNEDWDELSLFIQQKNKLHPIFRQTMQFQHALKGCIGSATGHDIWEYGRRTISIADTNTKGFSDLLVTEIITVDGDLNPMPKDIDTKKKTRSYLMKYDGKEYH